MVAVIGMVVVMVVMVVTMLGMAVMIIDVGDVGNGDIGHADNDGWRAQGFVDKSWRASAIARANHGGRVLSREPIMATHLSIHMNGSSALAVDP